MAGGAYVQWGSFGMRADSADGFCVGGEGGTDEEAWGAGSLWGRIYFFEEKLFYIYTKLIFKRN
jgi:hypothetical protein